MTGHGKRTQPLWQGKHTCFKLKRQQLGLNLLSAWLTLTLKLLDLLTLEEVKVNARR